MSNLLSRLRSASMVIPAALVLGACQQPVKPVAINIAAINDFHGNLAATPFTYETVLVSACLLTVQEKMKPPLESKNKLS